jgi:DNA-binding response OmpR family regulator
LSAADGLAALVLSLKEYDLLRVLVQHAGKILTHGFS